jgi:hypothetical protein
LILRGLRIAAWALATKLRHQEIRAEFHQELFRTTPTQPNPTRGCRDDRQT